MTIIEMYIECFKDTPVGTNLSRKDIITALQAKYDIDERSILPTDLCYNSSNLGVEGNGKERLFLKTGRGQFLYVGPDYDASQVNPYEFGTIGTMAQPDLQDAVVGEFDSWRIISKSVAVKETDKSVFEYHTTGIPKAIKWFFSAEKLNKGDKLGIELLYSGAIYDAYVEREQMQGRTRMVWFSDLSEALNGFFTTMENYPLLVFEKKTETSYSIHFEKGAQKKYEEPLDVSRPVEEQEQQALGMDLASLENAARKRSTKKPIGKEVSSVQYFRDPYIAEYAKRRANGVCQLCGRQAPFLDSKGNPYLESHHIIWISKGGEDSIENTVGLCPNCHRKMHIVADPSDIELLLGMVKTGKELEN